MKKIALFFLIFVVGNFEHLIAQNIYNLQIANVGEKNIFKISGEVYESFELFGVERIKVSRGGLYGIINPEGEIVIPIKYQKIDLLSSSAGFFYRAWLDLEPEKEKCNLWNHSGEHLYPDNYYDINVFANVGPEYISLRKYGSTGIIESAASLFGLWKSPFVGGSAHLQDGGLVNLVYWHDENGTVGAELFDTLTQVVFMRTEKNRDFLVTASIEDRLIWFCENEVGCFIIKPTYKEDKGYQVVAGGSGILLEQTFYEGRLSYSKMLKQDSVSALMELGYYDQNFVEHPIKNCYNC